MEFIKKGLILIIIVVFIYILLRLLQKRAQLIDKKISMEGYTNATVTTISNKTSVPNSITNMQSSYGSNKIRDFFVKSSLDSAYDGATVSVDMVNYVLSRGYRFVDFEVYLEPLTTAPAGTSPTAVVGYSNTRDGSRMSNNNIKLSEVITAIMQGAFTSTSPNPKDPFFLQIRPMYQKPLKTDDSATKSSKQGKNTQLNTQIESALDQLKNPSTMLAGMVDPSTTISSIAGKIVIIMDNNIIYGKKSDNLLSMISMSPTSKDMNTYNTGIITAQPIQQSVKPSKNTSIIQVLPFDDKNAILSDNPNPNSVIVQFKPNFSPYMAWIYNSNSGILDDYENLFVENGNSAFIELSAITSNASNALVLNSPVVGPAR
jgi:hypothetical protein